MPALTSGEIDDALARGAATADDCRARGLIVAVSLHLQGITRRIGLPADRSTTLPRSPETEVSFKRLANG